MSISEIMLVLCVLPMILGAEPKIAEKIRFKAPQHSSWGSLASLRSPPLGICWILASTCARDKGVVGLSDDLEEAYTDKNVGKSESACHSRAKVYWEMCGNSIHQPMLVYFTLSGAIASYPPDDLMENASNIGHIFTDYNIHFYEGLQLQAIEEVCSLSLCLPTCFAVP